MRHVQTPNRFRSQTRTKPWIKTLFVFFFVFVYFCAVWLLLGEFNLLGLNMVVYQGQPNPADPTLAAASAQIDPRLHYFLFVPGVFYFAAIAAMKRFGLVGWDLVPVTAAAWLTFAAVILTAALPNPYSILMLSARMLIACATFFALFFGVGFLTVKLTTNPYSGGQMDDFAAYVAQREDAADAAAAFRALWRANERDVLDVDSGNIVNTKPKKR